MSSGLSSAAKKLEQINANLETEFQKRLHYGDLPPPEEGQSRRLWIQDTHLPHLRDTLARLDETSHEAATVRAAIKYQEAVLLYLELSGQ